MKFNKLNSIIVLGLVAITGILVMQFLWIRQTYNLEEKKFSQKVHITLLQVVNKLYEYSNKEFPLNNPVNKVANDYYVVNVNNDFDAEVLEYCLRTEFEKANLLTDFEYAIYKCESDEMVYGNYVSFTDKTATRKAVYFPKQDNLVYYFAIRFPNETSYLISSLRLWIAVSVVLLVILVVYVYSVVTIIQQRKYSELQKDFINNMTHEFKTPLSSILLASSYLHKQEKIRNDETLEKYTSIIISQGTKLNSHIEKILNIARSDDAPLSLDKKDVDVLQMLEDVAENVRLKHDAVKIIIDNQAGEPHVEADVFHFSNLVYNLLDNSVKYCEEKQALIHIRLEKEGQALRIDVSDNGIGIPEKNLAYIFDKFYRINNRRDTTKNGFGLGLFYVKKVCDLHHWKVTAFNNLQQGITIRLTIPKYHEHR